MCHQGRSKIIAGTIKFLNPSFSDDSGGVIITGGFEGKTGVSRVSLYNLEGFQADLPSMLEARGGHACASFLNTENEMVIMYKY